MDEVPKDKKLIIFDLDGTLTQSKQAIDDEMAELLGKLLAVKPVAVIGGGKYELFQSQLLDRLKISEELLKNLFLFPTTSTAFYKYDGGQWKLIYKMELTQEEKKKIFDAFEKVFAELNYHPEDVYRDVVEDRGSEITFSGLGQDAPLDLKNEWKKENSELKLKMVEILQKYLPDMEVRAAGYTSIDITRKGIDKKYGVRQIEKYLGVSIEDILFVGDALFPGGNDSAALRTGVLCFEVKGPEETKKIIRLLISRDLVDDYEFLL